MTCRTTLRGAVCLAALLTGTAAMADVSAQQVWDDWKAQLSLYGPDTLTVGSEDMSGDTLTVRDIALNMVQEELNVSAAMGDIILTEQGDGTVAVTMADSFPVTVTDDAGVTVTVLVTQSGLEMIASGTADAIDYAVSADSYTVALENIVDGDFTFTGDVSLTGNNLTGTYTTRLGEMRDLTYEGSFESIDILVDVQLPDGGGEYITGGGKISGLNMQAELAMPLDGVMFDENNQIADGTSISAGYTVDSSEYVFDINADGDQVSGSFSSGAGSLTTLVSAETLAYSGRTTDIVATFISNAAPFPIDIGLSAYGFNLEMPVAASDTAQPFAFGIELADLTVSDMIWSLFDPSGVLPRDPATIKIGLAGMARPLFDVMDPTQEQAMMNSDMPFELSEVSLTDLDISVAGASVTGDGAFTFDNSDMVTFAPLPRPEGEVTVQINGLNGLLDNLVTMGLLPADQVMAPRMMMGMFARSTGDDQLETRLEVTEDGEVLANGQRIR
ncbi:DUF2125 domain-containing protein [Yoonia vestfoldensis]|uniref:DUF2125 domain-containing protein n=1 Tax=Yoonia vestfoldensis TaxID=245188 RepID=UPI001FDFE0EB|nr:DUF2125 domain-containing protein [Yoonia vestfoldensis]